MKTTHLIALIFLLTLTAGKVVSQDQPIYPTTIRTGHYYGLSKPLRDLPVITDDERKALEEREGKEDLNKWPNPTYPYAATALPQGPDPVWQNFHGEDRGFETDAIGVNFDGQSGRLDPTGCIGPNHYMQTINFIYAIYDRVGTLLAGPTALNLLFGAVPGSGCNDGDPIVLYDEQADRWLVAEFSLCGANDYMLIAISQTNDPTGAWHQYSFDVDDVPDYMKFGVWRDAYYMGTNTHAAGSDDCYAFERSKMLTGDPTAQMIGFDNPWRPGNSMGVQAAIPADNDWTFAPVGEPGIFLILNEDGAAGGSDQLWIMELAVNWTTPASSTFTRVQQLNVAAFTGDFGAGWDNIAQSGVAQELCAVSDIVMNAPQYINFGTHETIVLCHTVDVDNTDHAGIRWYELRRTTGNWTIRQQGSYAPDAHSRFMGSIHMNQYHEIGLGYSISSSTLFPGIRVCGQNALENALATGIMNVAEMTVVTGTVSQTGSNRWGDYTACFVDPVDDRTFWYTNMYFLTTTNARPRKICSFNVYPATIYVDQSVATSGNGTSAAPVKTVKEALNGAGNGTDLYIKGGTYDEVNPLFFPYEDMMLYKWGTSGNPVIK
ncbi:MAG: hypothetical protein FJY10_07545 [Bacteroidetes bacterium]|nr:hypothetical protein [Bacteroidota bacterium]